MLPYQALVDTNARDVKARYDDRVIRTDEHYVYLGVKPRADADAGEFQHFRVAFYGPGAGTEDVAYLPAHVFVLKPGGDTEVWKFRDWQVNLQNVTEANFQFVPPPTGWDKRSARPTWLIPAPPMPGRPDLKP